MDGRGGVCLAAGQCLDGIGANFGLAIYNSSIRFTFRETQGCKSLGILR